MLETIHRDTNPHLVAAPHSWNHLNQISYLGLIRPQDMVPVIHVLSLLVFSNCLQAFLWSSLNGFLLGRQPCRPIWCQCAAYGMSTDRLTPYPLTSAAMLQHSYGLFPKLNLWILSMCTQLLWSTWWGLFRVEPVLLNALWSWPPYSSSVSRSWQSYLSLRHLYVEQYIYFFTSSDQYERVRIPT